MVAVGCVVLAVIIALFYSVAALASSLYLRHNAAVLAIECKDPRSVFVRVRIDDLKRRRACSAIARAKAIEDQTLSLLALLVASLRWTEGVFAGAYWAFWLVEIDIVVSAGGNPDRGEAKSGTKRAQGGSYGPC